MRLIDADALLDFLVIMPIDTNDIFYSGLLNPLEKLAFKSLIDKMPTVDPVKHGHWIEENTRTHSMQFKCSVCGGIAYYPQNHHMNESKRCGYRYCGHCSAKMDE